MDGLKVSELADRSGVPASTVRYYEQQGLLPARRSSSGYRLYDDLAVDRLAFIGTAKGLGLELAEIRRLLEPWQHGRCSDVQRELLPLVARHLAQTRDRIRELDRFADRLVLAHAQLEAIEGDGPCAPSCTSLGHPDPAAGPVLGALPLVDADGAGDVIACSLGAGDRADRVEHWRTVLAAVTDRTAIPGGVRLTFDADRLRIAELAALAAAEAQCCGFLELTLHLGPPVVLDARAPEDALVLVHELFGEPDDRDAPILRGPGSPARAR